MHTLNFAEIVMLKIRVRKWKVKLVFYSIFVLTSTFSDLEAQVKKATYQMEYWCRVPQF